ncbi:hypothetical protein J1605_022275 [Eschrichtius robustus]|uniref:Melanoma antigen recognized by T-cells 1 n=1 Tax=Eschrichtius robustus TaxID=9764 RepID=A0AB34HAL5_ESCRO|nr:hypothetical protein J1605_022275 [Eschrichtius robustus]
MYLSISRARAAGIGILIVILGILLLISCWYCRRRSGYRSLKVIPTMKDRVSLGGYSHQAAALQCGDIYGKEKFLSLNKTPDQAL